MFISHYILFIRQRSIKNLIKNSIFININENDYINSLSKNREFNFRGETNMAFLSSPGVSVRELDNSVRLPNVGSTIGAIAGPFAKGPVSEPILVGDEESLVAVFGKPNASNFEWWFSAANYLQYSNNLIVQRTESAVVNAVASGTAILIRDTEHYQNSYSAGEASVGEWAARTAGTWGNSLGVSVCYSGNAYSQDLTDLVNDAAAAAGDTTITLDAGAATSVFAGDIISFSSANASADSTAFTDLAGHEGIEYEVVSISSHVYTIRRLDDPNSRGLAAAVADDSFIRRRWKYYDLFAGAPGQSDWAKANGRGTGDELHVVVFDKTGDITGSDSDVAGQRGNSVLETWAHMSKNPVAKTAQGGSNYYPDVMYRGSQYVYWMDHHSSGSNWGTDVTAAYTAVNIPSYTALASGTDDYAVTAGELEDAYDKYKNKEQFTIDIVIGGPSPTDTAAGGDTHVTMITALVDERKDCIATVSPYRSATVGVTSSVTQTTNVCEFFDLCPSSSYVVYDSGYKYMYDKYNDVFRHVPLNGDTAGLIAAVDKDVAPWFSPSGYTRGLVRGAVKLSYNPKQTERDQLYRKRINPVVNFSGQGVTLFGDKTALTKPSAFDRINVRRLFLIMERTIAEAAKYSLFEFNDEFTQSQFKAMVEPFLREIQGRRGIQDFSVVCDSSNNTPEVVDRNEFKADIFVQPARSINFISLTFVASRSGVSFNEVGG
jgi:hypothetical protein